MSAHEQAPDEGDARLVAAVTAIVQDLRAAGWVVQLRPKSLTAPSVFDGDVDMLADPARTADILRLALDRVRAHGVNLLVDQTAPLKRRLTFVSHTSPNRILLELWPVAEVLPADGARGGAPGAVAWRDVAPLLDRDDDGVRLPEDVETAFYLAHLHHKRKSLDSPEVQARLGHYRQALEASGHEVAAPLREAVDALLAGDLDLAGGNAVAVGALARRGVPVRTARGHGIQRLWQRARRGARRRLAEATIPVLGPDGVGKTTLIEQVQQAARLRSVPFKHVFRHAIVYRALHRVLRGRSGPQRNLLDERFVQLLLVVSRVRWTLFSRRALARADRGPVLVDRFVWDYLLRLRDPGRPPARVAGYRLHSALAPTPRRAIVLVCDLDTMLARKQELTPRAVDALYDVYCDQIARGRVGQVLVLSTDAPPQVATATVLDVLDLG